MLRSKGNYRGSALISALFIMTLVAIAATAMSTRLQLDIYRTRLSIASDKLYLASQAVQAWGLSEIADPNQKFRQADASGKVLNFPPKLLLIYPDIRIKGALYDLQARYNLNNVADKNFQISFQEFLKNTEKKLEQPQRIMLAAVLHNWLSPYQPGQDAMNNLSYYLKQKPPYYPAQQLMQNASEFRLLRGVNAKLYRNLENHFIALPEQTPININTASKPVLMSLGFGLNEEQVNELIEARGKKGLSDFAKITPLLQKLNIRSELLTIESQYFMSVATISSDDLNLTSYTILKRIKDNNGKVKVSLINQSMNVFE
ncbi:MAG: type II secretion system minor pseudopilin GspK [Tatlockia sp.]|nr:type II secretion system minor pseudopilin GspK [Tatlockia sp.]